MIKYIKKIFLVFIAALKVLFVTGDWKLLLDKIIIKK